MNKKILFLIFFFVLIWNMSILLFRDAIRLDNSVNSLEESESNAESEELSEPIAVYNHETKEIRHMPLEEYIVCVLSAEMPAAYGLEALKAQAVAARTYTVFCIENNKEKHDDADVCTDYKHCQAYKSNEEIISVFNDYQRSVIRQAVQETSGEIITYGNVPINAVYHASSDKKTESAENVWGGAIPYLTSVTTENESGMPGFNSELTLSEDGFFEKLSYAGVEGDFATDALSTCTNDSGRVEYVTVGTKNGENVNVSGVQMRSIFSLRSCSFDIAAEGGNITFKVRGYGHGVGMSQYGAKLMAESGSTYEQILLHYYTGCELSNLGTYTNF